MEGPTEATEAILTVTNWLSQSNEQQKAMEDQVRPANMVGICATPPSLTTQNCYDMAKTPLVVTSSDDLAVNT